MTKSYKYVLYITLLITAYFLYVFITVPKNLIMLNIFVYLSWLTYKQKTEVLMKINKLLTILFSIDIIYLLYHYYPANSIQDYFSSIQSVLIALAVSALYTVYFTKQLPKVKPAKKTGSLYEKNKDFLKHLGILILIILVGIFIGI